MLAHMQHTFASQSNHVRGSHSLNSWEGPMLRTAQMLDKLLIKLEVRQQRWSRAIARLQDVERGDVGRAQVDLLLQDDVRVGLQQPLVAHHLP